MIGLIKYNNSAFTLIEITIALLILAVGLVGILALFPVGFDAAGRAGNVTVATFKAQKIIEELKINGYVDPTTIDGNHGWCSDDPDNEYDYFEYEIDAIDGIPDPEDPPDGRRLIDNICEVTVTVYWPAGDVTPGNRGNQRSVELKTYIARYEPAPPAVPPPPP